MIQQSFSNIGSLGSRDVIGLITRWFYNMALHFSTRFGIGYEELKQR